MSKLIVECLIRISTTILIVTKFSKLIGVLLFKSVKYDFSKWIKEVLELYVWSFSLFLLSNLLILDHQMLSNKEYDQ